MALGRGMTMWSALGAVVVAGGLSMPALAQDDAAAEAPAAEEAPAAPAPTAEDETTKYDSAAVAENKSTISGESARARAGRIAGVGLTYGGFVAPIMGAGFDAYWQAFPSLQVGLSHSSGKFDLSGIVKDTDDVDVTKAEISAAMTTVNARWFPGNSFYLNLGLGQRTVAAEFAMTSKALPVGIDGKIEAKTNVLVLAIGNQWQWDSGFTFGVEWLGYAAAMGAKSSGELEVTGSAPETDELKKTKKDSEDTAETIGEAGTARALMFNFGWAF